VLHGRHGWQFRGLWDVRVHAQSVWMLQANQCRAQMPSVMQLFG